MPFNPDNTYAFAQGEKSINWDDFLRKNIYTTQELLKASGFAGNWVTCGVGNQCAVIPRYTREDQDRNLGYEHEPKNKELSDLGIVFYQRILDMYNSCRKGLSSHMHESRIDALQVLRQIERHSTQIIKQIQDHETKT